MIYIHRNWDRIPQNLKDDLQSAADALDAIDDKAGRAAFIKANASKWTAIREYLSAMSEGKCWYSEARESVSRYHVDHFRPHGRAKQAEKLFAEGYSWLAFTLENFRIAGMLCNTANQEHSEETVGKADWFPLIDPSKRASLASRDLSGESPILLDPTDIEEPDRLRFNDDGRVVPDGELEQEEKDRVSLAIRLLGLDQSQLDRSRRKTWRDCARRIAKFERIARKPRSARSAEEVHTLSELISELLLMARASSEFAAVSRCCLLAHGLGRLVIRDEMAPLAAND